MKIAKYMNSLTKRYMTYEEKINYLRNKLRNHSNPYDKGWKKVSDKLGMTQSKLKDRIVKGLYKKEWDLAADALISHIEYQEELDKFSYVIK